MRFTPHQICLLATSILLSLLARSLSLPLAQPLPLHRQPSSRCHRHRNTVYSSTITDISPDAAPITAVIIVDHGSRKAEANDMLFEVLITNYILHRLLLR
jgi:hypothetical protein